MDELTEMMVRAEEYAQREQSRAQVYAILALATAIQNIAVEFQKYRQGNYGK